MDYRALDVESHSLKVEQHLKRVADGTYRLPEFQRTFVWGEERVAKLWDSLYLGFPIGQLMFWEPEGAGVRNLEFPMRSLGRRQVDVFIDRRTMAIIDGQQRLTALYLVLTGEIPLRFDLEQERFLYTDGPASLRLDILRDPQGKTIAYSEAAGSQFFFLHATDEQRAKHARAINRLNGALTQRELPSQVIRDVDYATVIGVFKRLNQQGEPLNQAQLTMAGISEHWPSVFRRTYQLLEHLNVDMGFEESDDPTFVFRVWAAVHTGQHLVKHLAAEDPRSRYAKLASRERYEISWTAAERGIRGLIDLMRRQLELRSFKFIRGQYPLAVAAHYLATHPAPQAALPSSSGSGAQWAPKPEAESALKRWLVLSIVTGRYHERAETKYAADIKATAANADISELFKHRNALDPATIDAGHLATDKLAGAGFRSAYATLLYLVARKLGATDLLEYGARVGDDLAQGSWQLHHIFPRSCFESDLRELEEALEDAQAEGDEEKVERIEKHLESLDAKISSLGNLAFVTAETQRTLIDRAPADYLRELASTPEGQAALEAQVVSLDPALWKPKMFDTFCRRRCELLAAKAKELFFARS